MTEERSEPKGSAVFSEEEAEFLAERFIARVATVSEGGQPHVVPVAYRFDGRNLDFGGWNLRRSLKFRNLAGNARVAVVVDEILSTKPWRACGVEVRGTAEPYTRLDETRVRIRPREIRSWGLGDSSP